MAKANKPDKQAEPQGNLTLEELDRLCREQVKVLIPLVQGPPIEVEARRLTPAEAARVNLEMRRALPKIVPGDKPGEERFDLADPEYRRNQQEALVRARALAVYLAVPMYQQARPGLENLDEITAFVQGKLTEEVLVILCNAIIPGLDDQVSQATSFFS